MAVRTRDDIARVLAPKMGMTHQDSERYLKELIAYMTKALKNGPILGLRKRSDEIVFRGFGWRERLHYRVLGSRPKREKPELRLTRAPESL